MSISTWIEFGSSDKKLEAKVKWFDTIPFMKNKVAPAIEEHVKQGGQEPSLIAFRVIGRDRATIFAESHDRTQRTFRNELESWVQLHLTKKFGNASIETERRADGRAMYHDLDAGIWTDLHGWITSSMWTRLRKEAT